MHRRNRNGKSIARIGASDNLRSIKWGYATQSLEDTPQTAAELWGRLDPSDDLPNANDVIVAEVIEIGQHKRIEGPTVFQSYLFQGDLVGVAYGNRYATNQFEGTVPDTEGICDMLSVGGVCGKVVGRSSTMAAPTVLRPLGYLLDQEGARVNLEQGGIRPLTMEFGQPTTILVVGSSMDSGKTMTAFSLVHGLTKSGAVVCAGKITGTASAKDIRYMTDAGAVKVLDFTDVGYASTAGCTRSQLANIFASIGSHLYAAHPDYMILEIADGLVQSETAALLDMLPSFHSIDYTVFACCDCLSVATGVRRLREYGMNVVAISGRVTISPLSTREAQAETDLPVIAVDQLREPRIADLFSKEQSIFHKKCEMA